MQAVMVCSPPLMNTSTLLRSRKDAETERIALAVHGAAAKVYDILMEPCLAPVKDEPSGARLIGKGG